MDMEKMFGILIFFAGITTILVGGGFGILTIIHRLRRNQAEWQRFEGAGELTHELDELRLRLEELERRGMTSGEVEAQYARLGELEERLDFTERLLAQRNDQSLLPEERRVP